MASLTMAGAKPFAGARVSAQFGRAGVAPLGGVSNGTAAKLAMKSKKTYNVEVAVGVDEPADSALRRFRRAVTSSGVIPELRRRRYFENTQDMRKRKVKELRMKNKKNFRVATWEDTQNTPPAPFADLFGEPDDIFGEV
eukprot:jgi/Tetstr1/464609/TSEL_009364.t2